MTRVFLYQGKPITLNFSQGLQSACKKAGIQWGRDVKGGFICHDLRHCFITDCRRAGVDRTVTMSITGHAVRDMNERYDVVSDQDKADAVVKLTAYRANLRQSNKAGMLANR
jgi:integrase